MRRSSGRCWACSSSTRTRWYRPRASLDELWGERPPATATKVVQTYVSQLRKVLGDDLIATRPPGYLLRIREDELDAERFRRMAADGHELVVYGNHERADALYREALALWRGRPLADVAFESFARSEVERLEEERLDALTDRIDCELALGRHHELTSELESLVKQYPLRERLRAQLMLALYRSGRQADALAAYQDARRTLVEELGLEPGRELQELERAILVHEPALEAPRARSVLVRARRGRGRLIVLPAATLAVVAIALPLVLRAGSGGISAVSPNAVGVIDPESNSIVGEVAVGVAPEAVAVGAGGAWVANVDDETVSRIDPATRRLTRTISVDDYPSDVAVGQGSVWVALGPLAMLSRIAVERDQAIRPTPAVDEDVVCGRPFASLAVGGGGVWFVCETGEVGRFESRISHAASASGTRRGSSPLRARSRLGSPTSGLGLGSVWLVNRAANNITEIDPLTNRVVREITVGAAPTAIAVGQGSLWVTNFDDDTVTRIPASLSRPVTTTRIVVGDGPVDVAVGEGAVGVANSRDGTVSRIDPVRNEVEATVIVGNQPRRLAVGESAVWVSVRDPAGTSAP